MHIVFLTTQTASPLPFEECQLILQCMQSPPQNPDLREGGEEAAEEGKAMSRIGLLSLVRASRLPTEEEQNALSEGPKLDMGRW